MKIFGRFDENYSIKGYRNMGQLVNCHISIALRQQLQSVFLNPVICLNFSVENIL